MKCNKKCQVYSRVVGYFRPIETWNAGKEEEYNERVTYDEKKSLKTKFKSK